MSTYHIPVAEPRLPFLLRLLGAKWRDHGRSYRMKWGELSLLSPGWALELLMFGDPNHFTLKVHVPWLAAFYIRLPFLNRFAREPEEMLESWGVSYSPESGGLHLRWGTAYKILTMPWRDWGRNVAHEVLRPDGSWVPHVYEWDRDKEPDGRLVESYPYHYLLRSGEKQTVTATIHVERRTWRLRWLRWTSAFQKQITSIDVAFSDEVGEGTGSWKGGTLGCSYDLRPNETPRECLRRMESERKFT